MNGLTIQEIADELDVPYDHVRWLLRKLAIEPVRIVGRTKLYTTATMKKLQKELSENVEV